MAEDYEAQTTLDAIAAVESAELMWALQQSQGEFGPVDQPSGGTVYPSEGEVQPNGLPVASVSGEAHPPEVDSPAGSLGDLSPNGTGSDFNDIAVSGAALEAGVGTPREQGFYASVASPLTPIRYSHSAQTSDSQTPELQASVMRSSSAPDLGEIGGVHGGEQHEDGGPFNGPRQRGRLNDEHLRQRAPVYLGLGGESGALSGSGWLKPGLDSKRGTSGAIPLRHERRVQGPQRAAGEEQQEEKINKPPVHRVRLGGVDGNKHGAEGKRSQAGKYSYLNEAGVGHLLEKESWQRRRNNDKATRRYNRRRVINASSLPPLGKH